MRTTNGIRVEFNHELSGEIPVEITATVFLPADVEDMMVVDRETGEAIDPEDLGDEEEACIDAAREAARDALDMECEWWRTR